MSSDSSSNYDGNVLFDDDELISRSDSRSSDTEAESTHCFHPEQPDFIPPTSQTPPSTPGISESFFSIGLSPQTSQRSRGRSSVAALIREFITNAPLPTNHKRGTIQVPD